MATGRLNPTEINELVGALPATERAILLNLYERGPALPLEVAVRLLKMPNEVDGPLGRLAGLGLVQTSSINTNNVLRLSDLGNQVVGVLQDSNRLNEIDAGARQAAAQVAAKSAVEAAQAPQPQAMALAFSAPAPDPREREIALLLQLADLAKEAGDLNQALQWTKEALDVQRSLAAGARQ